jgi:hypothetical protein
MQEVKLNKKQEAFAQAYVKLGDASAAYREVYSYKNMKPEVIHVRACEMVKHSKVSVRINDLKSKIAEIAEKKFNITSEEMLRHLNILRSARIDEYVEFIEVEIPTTTTTGTGKNKVTSTTVDKRNELRFKTFDKLTEEQLMCIESVKQDRYGRVELKLHGKEWTIEKINKHIGFYEKDNNQKSTTVVLEDENSVKDRVAALMAKMNK